MDDADRADSRIEQMIADGMARAKLMAGRNLPLTGKCHWCNDDVKGRIFCSKECSVDWQANEDAKKRNGG